jgi:anti-sigma factor RsiW
MLSAYVDGELSASDRATVERALAADPRLQELERSMRGLGAAVRALSETEVARVDFTGLADRVLGRVSRRPGVLDRLREAMRRPWLPVGGLVAVAAATFFFLRPVEPPASAAGVVVQSVVTADSSAQLQPVVLKTESGDAIIWLVEHPDASGAHRPTVLPPDKPVQAPVPAQPQRPRAGEL